MFKRLEPVLGVPVAILAAIALVALIAAGALLLSIAGGAAAPALPLAGASTAPAAPAASTTSTATTRPSNAAGADRAAARAQRARLLGQYQLAERTLCTYLQASQYPPASRPMAQNADQAYPNAPVTAAEPMRLDGGGSDGAVLLQTSQSRVYMAAGETVAFSLRAVDRDGATLPLVVTRALAFALAYNARAPGAQVALAFADDGAGADPVAGDGALAAVLAPAQTGLASFDGTIRSVVEYSVGGKRASVAFDVVYSPVPPATWTGPVRTVQENGALNFYLPATMRVAGRYIISARLDDARGRPFALLTFNDLLPAGPNEVRLSAFGKLLRDGQPVQPLTLRDVDGYLLRENADPDRALMPRLAGAVATSARHALSDFSDAPYDGEERRRYLARFGQDLRQARAALLRAAPDAALPASACGPDGASAPVPDAATPAR